MADLRRMKRAFAASPALAPVAGLLDRVTSWRPGECAVLTLHRIDTGDPRLYPGLASVDGHGLREIVAAVNRHFQPVSIHDVLAALRGEQALPDRAALFTFDDAYQDFADIAWPILRDASVPVVLFVPTDFPDRPDNVFWWDRLHEALHTAGPERWELVGAEGDTSLDAFRSLRGRLKALPHDAAMAEVDAIVSSLGGCGLGDVPLVAGWSTIRRLGAEGVALAPHSRSHPLLDRLDRDRLADEVAGSRDDLVERLGAAADVVNVFAYPSGGHDPTVRAAVVSAGFEAAFTTERGVARVGYDDPFRIPRLNIGTTMTPALLRMEAAVRRLQGRISQGPATKLGWRARARS